MCFCKICGIGRGIFVYSFHSACDIIKKNVETGRIKMPERNIKFEYFGMVRQRKESNRWKGKGKVEIGLIIDSIDREQLLMKTIDLGDIKARIERFQYLKKNDVWVFRFMKLREDNVPSIAKENEEAEGIPLEDDEYIGEDLYMLYDNTNGIAMVQSNRFALGLKRVESLLSYIWNIEGERIRLKAIVEKFDLGLLGRKRYKSIEIGFANIDTDLSDGANALGAIMNSYRKLNGVAGTIRIGLGRTRRDTLDIDEVNKLIREGMDDSSVTSIKLKVKDDDDRPVEEIDLFDNVCRDIIPFNMPKRTSIDFQYAADRMIKYYGYKKLHLISLVSPKK